MSIVVKSYSDEVVSFTCNSCKIDDTCDVSHLITDNCAVDVNVVCRECADAGVVYILRCTDAALAKDLNGKLEVLRLNRMAGGVADEYKDGEQSCC